MLSGIKISCLIRLKITQTPLQLKCLQVSVPSLQGISFKTMHTRDEKVVGLRLLLT